MASLIKRGKIFQAQFYIGGRLRRRSLRTTSLQVAKEKLWQLESAIARGNDSPLPSRTRIADVVTSYVEHIRAVKTPKIGGLDMQVSGTPLGFSGMRTLWRNCGGNRSNMVGMSIILLAGNSCQLPCGAQVTG